MSPDPKRVIDLLNTSYSEKCTRCSKPTWHGKLQQEVHTKFCADMRVADNASNRMLLHIPSVDDVSCVLNGAKFFSELDLSQSYHR